MIYHTQTDPSTQQEQSNLDYRDTLPGPNTQQEQRNPDYSDTQPGPSTQQEQRNPDYIDTQPGPSTQQEQSNPENRDIEQNDQYDDDDITSLEPPSVKKPRKKNKKMSSKPEQEEFDVKLLQLVMDRPSLWNHHLDLPQRSKEKKMMLWRDIQVELTDSGKRFLPFSSRTMQKKATEHYRKSHF